MQDFRDKVAVVTGGGSGIGFGIARALAKEGAKIVIADLDEGAAKRAAETLRGLGAESLAVATDVRRSESVEALAERVDRELGGPDLLFNNAGVYLGGPMRRATEDDWRFVMDVNLDGVFRVGQTFAKRMLDRGRGGYVVNTASVGGFLSYGPGVAYSASKYAVVAYSEAMRMDLEPDGIGVSTLCPGPIDTNLPASDRIRGAAERAGGFSEALAPLTRGGMKPEQVGPIVLAGIRNRLPYIFTHDDLREAFAERFRTVMACFDRIGDPPGR